MMPERATSPTAGKAGFRGYISSRPINGDRTPQHVQNLVIRDYARRKGLAFKLSATEYAMPGCYLMLDGVLDEIDRIEGIIAYSLFMLPSQPARRRAVMARVLAAGCTLHAAVEEYCVAGPKDVEWAENVWRLNEALGRAPKHLPENL